MQNVHVIREVTNMDIDGIYKFKRSNIIEYESEQFHKWDAIKESILISVIKNFNNIQN